MPVSGHRADYKSGPVVTVRESGLERGRRIMSVDDGRISAVCFPADGFLPEGWHIRVDADLAPAVVRSEDDARAWLTFLAEAMTRNYPH
jgi:hypothetical protein